MEPRPVGAEDASVHDEGARPLGAVSLADRIRQRERELKADRPIDLDVPGYEGVLVARYRALSFREINAINKQHEKTPAKDRDLFAAADFLIRSSEDLLEQKPDGELESLGLPWGLEAVRQLWGKEASTARQALLAVFQAPRDRDMVEHSNELMEAARARNQEVSEDLAGE